MQNPHTMKAYGFLRSKILAGEFQPGMFLSAQKLSKEIGVSRTPVREALRQLENDELVTIMPKLGAVVRTLNEEQFRELLGYREALEVHAAGQAAEMRLPHEVEHLRELLEAIRKQVDALSRDANDAEALRQLSRADQLFHHAILKIARNGFIQKHFERLDILQRLTMPALMHRLFPVGEDLQDRARKALGEHEAIFSAICAGDAEQARQSMRLHIANIYSKLAFHGELTDRPFPMELVASI